MFTEEEWEEAFKVAAGTISPRKRVMAPGYIETAEIVNGMHNTHSSMKWDHR